MYIFCIQYLFKMSTSCISEVLQCYVLSVYLSDPAIINIDNRWFHRYICICLIVIFFCLNAIILVCLSILLFFCLSLSLSLFVNIPALMDGLSLFLYTADSSIISFVTRISCNFSLIWGSSSAVWCRQPQTQR